MNNGIPGFRGAGIDRRDFMKTALAIGGTSALSACMDFLGGSKAPPSGVEDPSTLPNRQHEWNPYLKEDDYGVKALPKHHLLLYLSYTTDDGKPSDSEREQVEQTLKSIERAVEFSPEGVLFTLGYSPTYFDRYGKSLPDNVDLPQPRALNSMEDPELDQQDALLHMASDRADVLLTVEQALFGEKDTLYGTEMRADFDGVLRQADRRTGFIGAGLPTEKQDVDGIPDSASIPDGAPVFMGFRAGFPNSQATEDYVTLSGGPFAGGTTQHVSKLRLRLRDWWIEQDHEDRVAELYSPEHAEQNLVGDFGEKLGDHSGLTDEIIENIEEHAQEYGRVGHAQKAGRGREDGTPPLLRRDFDSTDNDEAGTHFVALQERVSQFESVRESMTGADLAENQPTIKRRVNNGILEYVFVSHRGNFLIPPRSSRSLPSPIPS